MCHHLLMKLIVDTYGPHFMYNFYYGTVSFIDDTVYYTSGIPYISNTEPTR